MKNNVLVIDENHPQVIYQKSAVCNNFEYNPSFKELMALYKEDHESIFQVNTKNHISLLTEDDIEISLHQYSGLQKIKFLKFINETLSSINQEIILSVGDHNYNSNSLQWSRFAYRFQEPQYCFDAKLKAVKDFDGYGNTQRIKATMDAHNQKIADKIKNTTDTSKHVKIFEHLQRMQIIEYCSNLKFDLDNNVYQGYVPSLGEMKIIKQNISIINYIFKKIGSEKISFYDFLISSTECGPLHDTKKTSYVGQWSYTLDRINESGKLNHFHVLPVFKRLIKENNEKSDI